DVAVRAGLLAVAVEGDRLVADRLADEVGHRAPVVRVHTWAVGIEYAHDAPVQAVIAYVNGGQHLREALAFVVAGPRPDGVDVAPMLLLLRVDQRVAVRLGGGGHEEPGVVTTGQVQHVVGAPRVDHGDL